MTAVRHFSVGALLVTTLCHAAVQESSGISRPVSETHAQPVAAASETTGQADATNAETPLQIGYRYYENKAYKDAIEPLRTAVSLASTNYKATLRLGYCYYVLEDYRAAVDRFRKAIELDPKDPAAPCWLADALYAMRQFDQAAEAYRQALLVKTNFSRAWLGLGYCQYCRRTFQNAAESFRQSASIEPSNFLALFWLGQSLVQLDQVEDAASAFEKAVNLNPKDYEANVGRGVTLLRLFRYKEATANLEQALASKPSGLFARWGLFVCYAATGQMNKISNLHLGIVPAVLILTVALYLPALGLMLRKSLQTDTRPAPGFGFTCGWCSVTMLGQTVAFLMFSVLFSWSGAQALGPGVSLSALPLIGAAIWGFSRQPWGIPFALRQQLPGIRLVVLALVVLGGAMSLEPGYTWLFEHITGKPMPEQVAVTWLGANTHSLWLTLLGIGLLAPAAEEILFRGLLFGAIGKWLSARWTIILTALLFSLVHLQPSYFLPLFVVGLLLGWARHKSAGLALPVLLHCINNCIALLMTKPPNGP